MTTSALTDRIDDLRAVLDSLAAGETVDPELAKTAITELTPLVPGLDRAIELVYLGDDDDAQPDAHRQALLRILDDWGQPDPGMLAKLPRFTGDKNNRPRKTRCSECNGWHEQPSVHLDYLGHADTTEALLKIDPFWNWRPAAIDPNTGGPVIRAAAGKAGMVAMWAYLTVLGVERLCVGTAQSSKEELEKELIGDMIRNGALRFGVAVRLWSKADHAEVADTPDDPILSPERQARVERARADIDDARAQTTTTAPTSEAGALVADGTIDADSPAGRLIAAASAGPKRAKAVRAARAFAQEQGDTPPGTFEELLLGPDATIEAAIAAVS